MAPSKPAPNCGPCMRPKASHGTRPVLRFDRAVTALPMHTWHCGCWGIPRCIISSGHGRSGGIGRICRSNNLRH
jgi:hypothetical protein